jgi:hypothetical protein
VNVTVDLLQEYKDTIDDTTMRLEMHLQKISDKLDGFTSGSREHSGEETLEWQDMQDEKESTEQCLEICAEFLNHIEKAQKDVAKGISTASEPNQVHIATTSHRVTARKVIVNTLDDLRLRLDSAKALLEKISPASPNTIMGSSHEQSVERKQLQDEFEGITKALEVCADASEIADSNRVISFSRVSMKDDGLQVIVATMGDLLRVSDITVGDRSAQIMGQMTDESLQQLSRDQVHRRREKASEALVESDPEFEGKYGAGVRLMAGKPATGGARKP